MTMHEWNKRPKNPTIWDDEFETDLMHPKWVPMSPPQTLDPIAEYPLDPHTSSGGDNWENVHRHKTGWWCRQGGAIGNNVQGYSLDISQIPSECVLFMRGGRGVRRASAIDADCEIMARISDDAFSNYVLVMWDSFANIYSPLFARNTPGLGYLNIGLLRNYFGFGEPIEYLAAQKMGGAWSGYGASRGGNWVYLGGFTHTVPITKISITFNNDTTAAPGTGLAGLDFFRVIPGTKLP